MSILVVNNKQDLKLIQKNKQPRDGRRKIGGQGRGDGESVNNTKDACNCQSVDKELAHCGANQSVCVGHRVKSLMA